MQDYTLFGALHIAAFLVALVTILKGNATVPTKVLWIALILFLPCVGLIAWYFLGPKS